MFSGKVSPSGKLTDTWAAKYDDYPCAAEYLEVEPETTEEDYKEGIYVGYRYFSSCGVKPEYSFGYGLSYTTFAIRMKNFLQMNEKIRISVEIKNTGREYAGKEVVQVYVERPWGRQDHEARSLVGFIKTGNLKPQETVAMEIEFDLYDLASYDEAAGEWFLEKGEYGIYLGTSAEDAKEEFVLL